MDYNVPSPLPRPCSGLEEDARSRIQQPHPRKMPNPAGSSHMGLRSGTRPCQEICFSLEAFTHANPCAWNVLSSAWTLTLCPQHNMSHILSSNVSFLATSSVLTFSFFFITHTFYSLHHPNHNHNFLLFTRLLSIPP